MSIRVAVDEAVGVITVTGDVETSLEMPTGSAAFGAYVATDGDAVIRYVPGQGLEAFAGSSVDAQEDGAIVVRSLVHEGDNRWREARVEEVTISASPPACLLSPVVSAEDQGVRDFWSSLDWRPIADYDVATSKPVMLGREEHWAFGFFGDTPHGDPDFARIQGGSLWRHAPDCDLYMPIWFQPDRFAEVGDEWVGRLCED